MTPILNTPSVLTPDLDTPLIMEPNPTPAPTMEPTLESLSNLAAFLPPDDTVLALDHVLTEVLSLPMDAPARSAFPEFWIYTIHDLMNCKPREDLVDTYNHQTISEEGVTTDTPYGLPPMLIRNIELLQAWYYEQCDPDYCIWFSLYSAEFSAWKNQHFHGPKQGQNQPIV